MPGELNNFIPRRKDITLIGNSAKKGSINCQSMIRSERGNYVKPLLIKFMENQFNQSKNNFQK